MKRHIQAVFFDAGYTLLCMDPDQPTTFRRVCAELDIALDDARFDEGIARANELLAPRHPREVAHPFSQAAVDDFWIAYNRALLSVCARRSQDRDRAAEVYRRFNAAIRWRVYEEVPAVLAGLRNLGMRLGVISNWTGDLDDVLARTSLLQRLDFVLDSSRFGFEKPHGPIFNEALRRTGVAAHAAMHVGDSPEHDVEGALSAGLAAVLLDRTERHPDFTRAPRIENLTELTDLLSE